MEWILIYETFTEDMNDLSHLFYSEIKTKEKFIFRESKPTFPIFYYAWDNELSEII